MDAQKTTIVRKLRKGEQGYTLPWAIYVDCFSGQCWIHGEYEVYPRRGQPWETTTMPVERTERGLVVSVPRGTVISVESVIPWTTTTQTDLLPIVEIREI